MHMHVARLRILPMHMHVARLRILPMAKSVVDVRQNASAYLIVTLILTKYKPNIEEPLKYTNTKTRMLLPQVTRLLTLWGDLVYD